MQITEVIKYLILVLDECEVKEVYDENYSLHQLFDHSIDEYVRKFIEGFHIADIRFLSFIFYIWIYRIWENIFYGRYFFVKN
jgi:hypothetical protein